MVLNHDSFWKHNKTPINLLQCNNDWKVETYKLQNIKDDETWNNNLLVWQTKEDTKIPKMKSTKHKMLICQLNNKKKTWDYYNNALKKRWKQ